MKRRMLVLALTVALSALAGSHTYQGRGAFGIAVGADTCMTGVQFGVNAGPFICQGD